MHQTHLEILVDSVHKNKENVGAVGDVDVRRRFAQFDARHSGSLSQRPAVSVMLRQNSLQLVNKLLLHSTNRQNTHFLSRLSVYQVQSSTITYTFWVGSPYVCLRKLITTFFYLTSMCFQRSLRRSLKTVGTSFIRAGSPTYHSTKSIKAWNGSYGRMKTY